MRSHALQTLPRLCVVLPAYNEEEVLPITAPLFCQQIESMIDAGLVSPDSVIMYVDDGSTDATWRIITTLCEQGDGRFCAIQQSRNRGHQAALVAGLMESRSFADIVITADCDGQDDIGAMTAMVQRYLEGYDVVYGVRSSRKKDSFFKRATAQAYYKLLACMGTETVYNHADYRLCSKRVLDSLANFEEVNLYLRGLFPLVGFPSTQVPYERAERVAGTSHYPLSKMLGLAFDGVTSLSVRPVRMIAFFGAVVSLVSAVGILWAVLMALTGNAVSGWASTICVICFFGGCQLLATGVIGEYVGKTYLEAKRRPRYVISARAGALFSQDTRR